MGFLSRLTQRRTLADRYLERGLDYLDQKKYDQAIADLTEAIAQEPGNAELYATRGFIYMEADEEDYLDYARADFKYALALDPAQMVAEYGLGMMAYAEEDYRGALQRFSTAREIAPLRPEIYYYRALCYFQLGDRRRAIDEMEVAMPLFEPEDPRHLDAAKWVKEFKKGMKKTRRKKTEALPEVDPRQLPAGEQPTTDSESSLVVNQ